MKNNPIGLFDSGIGGTSIWSELSRLLPYEDTIYLADSKNAPYGKKSTAEIIDLCIKNTNFLLEKGCKLIVVACNTATTNAISVLRDRYDIPFIGIEPAIKPAALFSKTDAIGILATHGTLSSKLFEKTAREYTQNITTIEQEGDGLVELIENGKLHSDEMTKLLHVYLEPMSKFNIDHLVLGCTHYPYLIPQIKKIIGDHIKIIDSGEAVARQTKNILSTYDLLSNDSDRGIHKFYINASKNALENILNTDIPNVAIEEMEF